MAKRRGHGEGSVYKRADGRWVASVDLGWESGKRRRRDLYGKTRREVGEKLARAMQAQREGRELPPERLMVGPFLADWLETIVKPTAGPNTYVSYETVIRLHLRPAFERTRLAKLTPQEVQRLLNKKHDEGLSPLRVRQIRSVLRNALNQALRWALVTRNVAALSDPPKRDEQERTALTVAQAQMFIRACRGDRLEALFTVALTLGLRQGEALGLDWEDLDLDAGILRVRHQIQRIDGKLQVSELKTKRSRRTLPLPPFAVTAFREHRARQRVERMKAGPSWQEQGLVFTTPTGGPLDARAVISIFRRLRASVEELPIFTFHDTRRTCSSLLTAQGVHPRVVMEILGHTQIAMSMETYTQVVPDLMRDAMGHMETMFGTVE